MSKYSKRLEKLEAGSTVTTQIVIDTDKSAEEIELLRQGHVAATRGRGQFIVLPGDWSRNM